MWPRTVSGEPQNFWCDDAGSTVEDGSIAKKFLLGEWQDWQGTEAPDLLPEERDAMGKNAAHSEETK